MLFAGYYCCHLCSRCCMQKLKPRGHRVLVYSQFLLMLDVLEWYCQARGHSFLRLDGSVGEQPAQSSAHMLYAASIAGALPTDIAGVPYMCKLSLEMPALPAPYCRHS
jgi:hypothetical protein